MLKELTQLADAFEELGIITASDLASCNPAFPLENPRSPVLRVHLSESGEVTKTDFHFPLEGSRNWAPNNQLTFPRTNISKGKDGELDFTSISKKLSKLQATNKLITMAKERVANLSDPKGLIKTTLQAPPEEIIKSPSWKDFYSPQKKGKARILFVPAERPTAISGLVEDFLKSQPTDVGNTPKGRFGGMPTNILSMDAASPFLNRWGQGFPAIAAAQEKATRLQATLDAIVNTPSVDPHNRICTHCTNGHILILAGREQAKEQVSLGEAADKILAIRLHAQMGSMRILSSSLLTLKELEERKHAFEEQTTPPLPLRMPGSDAPEGASSRQIFFLIKNCWDKWKQDGKKPPQPKSQLIPIPIEEDALYFPPNTQEARTTLILALRNTKGLLRVGRSRVLETYLPKRKEEAKKKNTTEKAKPSPWQNHLRNQNTVLRSLSWLLALQNMKPTKSNPSLLLGALLAAADQIHCSWSKARNNGKIPNGNLIGEATLTLATLNPNAALAQTSQKLQPILTESRRWKIKNRTEPLIVTTNKLAFLIQVIFEKLKESLEENTWNQGAEHQAALTLGYHSNPWSIYEKPLNKTIDPTKPSK